jgi:hypothetical protein
MNGRDSASRDVNVIQIMEADKACSMFHSHFLRVPTNISEHHVASTCVVPSLTGCCLLRRTCSSPNKHYPVVRRVRAVKAETQRAVNLAARVVDPSNVSTHGLNRFKRRT